MKPQKKPLSPAEEEAEIAEQVVVPIQYLHPSLTAGELEELLFRDLLGSQTTYYGGSTRSRKNTRPFSCLKYLRAWRLATDPVSAR